jgi:hypothetical protein
MKKINLITLINAFICLVSVIVLVFALSFSLASKQQHAAIITHHLAGFVVGKLIIALIVILFATTLSYMVNLLLRFCLPQYNINISKVLKVELALLATFSVLMVVLSILA